MWQTGYLTSVNQAELKSSEMFCSWVTFNWEKFYKAYQIEQSKRRGVRPVVQSALLQSDSSGSIVGCGLMNSD